MQMIAFDYFCRWQTILRVKRSIEQAGSEARLLLIKKRCVIWRVEFQNLSKILVNARFHTKCKSQRDHQI